jgi:hypothetical protein
MIGANADPASPGALRPSHSRPPTSRNEIQEITRNALLAIQARAQQTWAPLAACSSVGRFLVLSFLLLVHVDEKRAVLYPYFQSECQVLRKLTVTHLNLE